MNQELAPRVLRELMPWDEERVHQELAWLRLMARLKYDGYRDFHAGMRFIESFVNWIQQFDKVDREIAYAFVRNTLVYIGPSEINKLVEQFFPHTVWARLARIVASELNIPNYRVLVEPKAQCALERLRRQTLFMGLSDGARTDTIRHVNSELLSNEQFVQGTQVDVDKWRDLLSRLRKDLSDPCARFRLVYLIDDFTASGYSFLHLKEDGETWDGKLCRFKDSVDRTNNELRTDQVFDPSWQLCVHHYIASVRAKEAVCDGLNRVGFAFGPEWAQESFPSFGVVLPTQLPINCSRNSDFVDLTQKYYDPTLRTFHTDKGGVKHLGLGFGGCALPVVLEHNTPNNSVALLWADTDGGDRNGETHAMRPLFRRRQRHF